MSVGVQRGSGEATLRDAKLAANDFIIKSNAGLEFNSRFKDVRKSFSSAL